MIQIQLNGKAVTLPDDIDPSTPLLWVIREQQNLTGSKFGCGMSLCGACTMHVDGAAMRTCTLPISAVAGKTITTIEGLSGDHPVQKAWLDIDVPQCGYCQSGQIMSATALLEKNANPTDEDINAAMAGNICRCGTYPRIRRAIHQAAESMQSSTQEASQSIESPVQEYVPEGIAEGVSQ
ncbi:MAG: (2Fe-2S)-binding protein [Cellvibrionaceae bacterium]